MEQRINFITLGVDDLNKMKEFYNKAFGWKPIKDSDGIVFYMLNGLILALFPSWELAEEAMTRDDGKGFRKFSLAINFRSENEVDQAFDTLIKNGATAARKPEKVFWGGYRGYIADPENNYWELAYNPFLELDKEGNVKGHS